MAEFDAAETGKHDVRQQQIDAGKLLRRQTEGLFRIDGLQEIESLCLENLRDKIEKLRLVIDGENGWPCLFGATGIAGHCLTLLCGCVFRKPDVESRALARLALALDGAAVLPDDAIHGGQPETGALAELP